MHIMVDVCFFQELAMGMTDDENEFVLANESKCSYQ